MDHPVHEQVRGSESGNIYASVNDAGIISLVHLGSHKEVRHRYNQMVCLVGGAIQVKLAPGLAVPMHSRSAPAGTWVSRWTAQPIGDADTLFALASRPSSEACDEVGYQANFNDWPVGTLKLSGYKAMMKALSEIGSIFYSTDFKPTVQVGQSHDVSAVKRVREAITLAKRKGLTIYEEQQLEQFLKTLETARFLHFFHQV